MPTFLQPSVAKFDVIYLKIEQLFNLVNELINSYNYTIKRYSKHTASSEDRVIINRISFDTPKIAIPFAHISRIQDVLSKYTLPKHLNDQVFVKKISELKIEKENQALETDSLYIEWLRLLLISFFENLISIPYRNGREHFEKIFVAIDENPIEYNIPDANYFIKMGLPQFSKEYANQTFTNDFLPLPQQIKTVLRIAHDMACYLPFLLANMKRNLIENRPKEKTVALELEEEPFGNMFDGGDTENSSREKDFFEQTTGKINSLQVNMSLLALKESHCAFIKEYQESYELRNISKYLAEYRQYFSAPLDFIEFVVTFCNFVSWIEDATSPTLKSKLHDNLLPVTESYAQEARSGILLKLIELRHRSIHALDSWLTLEYVTTNLQKDESDKALVKTRSSIVTLIDHWIKNSIFFTDTISNRVVLKNSISFVNNTEIEESLQLVAKWLPTQYEIPNIDKIFSGLVLSKFFLDQLSCIVGNNKEEWKNNKKLLLLVFNDPFTCSNSDLRKKIKLDAVLQILGESVGNLYDYVRLIKNDAIISSEDYSYLENFIDECRDYRNLRTHHHIENINKLSGLIDMYVENTQSIKKQLDQFIIDFYKHKKTTVILTEANFNKIHLSLTKPLNKLCIIM